MSKSPRDDQHLTLMKLQKQNHEYREELKSVSVQLDQILQQQSKVQKTQNPGSLTAETMMKKIAIVETEIKLLKSKSPRSHSNNRLALEVTVKSLKEELKALQGLTKDAQRRLEEAHKASARVSSNESETAVAELRTAHEMLRKLEEKYLQGRKNNEKVLLETTRLQEKLQKINEIKIDILTINPLNETELKDGIQDLNAMIKHLEDERKEIEKEENEQMNKISSELHETSERVEDLRKEFKAKTSDAKLKDFEINELKRKLRSSSALRYSSGPSLQLDDPKPAPPQLSQVRSDTRLPSNAKKPPRAESSSPATQRITQLRTAIASVKSKVDSIKPPTKTLTFSN